MDVVGIEEAFVHALAGAPPVPVSSDTLPMAEGT